MPPSPAPNLTRRSLLRRLAGALGLAALPTVGPPLITAKAAPFPKVIPTFTPYQTKVLTTKYFVGSNHEALIFRSGTGATLPEIPRGFKRTMVEVQSIAGGVDEPWVISFWRVIDAEVIDSIV